MPFSTFEPAKSKGGWVGLEALAGIGWVDVTALGSIVGHQPLQRHVTAASVAGEHARETAEPQQDSGPTGCHLVGRAALACIGWVDVTALGSIVGHQPLQRHVTAASVAGEHACETAEPQQDSGPTGCHLVGRAGAV